jgi:MoxR-like ATPase
MRAANEFANAVLGAVSEEMYGMDEVTRLSLIALYTGGHVLLEGNPGFGKTEHVKTLGNVLKLPFGRIQFTPDLMPADITGTYMPDVNDGNLHKLKFREGPIFTSLLLADEINRATPKTQSAMLEAMAERQVTVLGEKKDLAATFMVLATQNPIDHEGTYNLPEAQADRFMFKVRVPVPDADTLKKIIRKRAGESASNSDNGSDPDGNKSYDPSLLPHDLHGSTEIVEDLKAAIKDVVPLQSVETHIMNMFLASNRRFEELEDLTPKQCKRVKRLVENLILYGLGPRAVIAMMLGTKAYKLLFLPPPEYADAPALGKIAIPALRHRVKLDIDWAHNYLEMINMTNSNESWLQDKLLADFCAATAPDSFGYRTKLLMVPAIKKFAHGERW